MLLLFTASISGGDLIHAAALIVPWVLTIFGWRYVSREADHRETRKECRAQVSEVARQITDAERDAIEYWTTSAGSKEIELVGARLTRSIASISRSIARLRPMLDVTEAQNHLLEFRKTCTGGTFQSANRVAVSHDDVKIGDISLRAMQIIEMLERTYAEKFVAK